MIKNRIFRFQLISKCLHVASISDQICQSDSIGNLLIGKSIEIEMDLLLRNPVSQDSTLQYAGNVRLKIILFFIHSNPYQIIILSWIVVPLVKILSWSWTFDKIMLNYNYVGSVISN